MAFHHIDRDHLVDALEAAGPDAPTLCEGWRTRHLAAHVVLREGSPLESASMGLSFLRGRAERELEDLAERSADAEGWAELLARLAAGPRGVSPVAWGGDKANLAELVIHTEDVRRGDGPAAPLDREPEHLDALFDQLRLAARLYYRRSDVGIVLVVPGGRRAKVKAPRDGAGTVVIRGSVVDLFLHASGRGAAADVEITGDPADVAALAATHPVRESDG
ncbi:MAG: TIGR03085 family protein [Actinomycetales bacterium]|nr:TIGR03085 family protein [Actinomycetales bacterium]